MSTTVISDASQLATALPCFVLGAWENKAMRRKRSEPVPIGEIFSELDGPVKKSLQPTPQSRHHFTQADQVNQLVWASEADTDLGFMAQVLALCSLPRTNPGNRTQYVRRNGPYTLVMNAGALTKLPYGNLPRLLMAWLSTEAVCTQSRELVLGSSLSEFMRTLGILSSDSGGATGVRTRLRNQMNRLFRAQVSLIYEDGHGETRASSLVADRTEFWWDPKRPNERMLWNSKIRLGEDLFNAIINHPVPLDLNILKSLTRCALGLDLYLWLTYRMFVLRAPLRLSWRQVYHQFGPNPNNTVTHNAVQNFRRRILRELKKIKLAWPQLNYTMSPGVLILLPSTPSIPPEGQLPSSSHRFPSEPKNRLRRASLVPRAPTNRPSR